MTNVSATAPLRPWLLYDLQVCLGWYAYPGGKLAPELRIPQCWPTLTQALTHSLPKLFPVFPRDEAIPLEQNNETKRLTFEICFAHKEIVQGEDGGNDEDIDFVSYFPILSLKIVTIVSRHNVHMWGSVGKQPYDDVRI